LRRRIALRRWQCELDAHQAARPLMMLDNIYFRWQQISPLAKLAAIPAGFLLKRVLFRRAGFSGLLLRTLPSLVGTVLKVVRS